MNASAQHLAQLEDGSSELSQIWNQQHDRHVLGQLLASVESQFAAGTWQAFYRVTLQSEPADQVAEEMGMSLNAVFIAKSRVLSRLRQEAAGLIDASQIH